MKGHKAAWLGMFLVLGALATCGGQPTPALKVLAELELEPGWAPVGEARVYDGESLYDLVNGQADAFLAYAFEWVTVQEYETGAGANLRLEVWRLATPADAYGLFTTFRSGTPVSVGAEGDADPGRRLIFWQGSHFVTLIAFQPLADADLQAFARSVAAALPSYPSGERPQLLDRLPEEGFVEGRMVFFHKELSLQNYLWLGGHNILELGPDTDGILAWYRVDGGEARLLLVEYPDPEAAAASLRSLEASDVSGLVAAQSRGELLAAVFAPADDAEARLLLAGVLER
jgi:hypothetical protein